jgi:integrase
MLEDEESLRDLASLAVPLTGSLAETGDPWLPFRLIDPAGVPAEAVSVFFADLQAAGRSAATLRSYGMDLLRWFRFLWAVQVSWSRATRVEARDFCRWMLVAGKPSRPHWRRPDQVPDSVPGRAYAPSVRAHSETVLRCFYDFHLRAGTGPIINPFPLDRSRRGGRAHAHHNPMEPYRKERSGLYRPVVPARIPRSVPDAEFNEIFARLGSHRDRALVAFYVSTGARASELLSATQGGADPGRQVITVIRKGSRAVQELPASTDAFVWLRLYQLEMDGLIPVGRGQPLWWTSRRPARPLTYHAAHRMFERGRPGGRQHGDLACAAPHGRLPDGRRPGPAAHRRPVCSRACPADHHADLPDPAEGRGDPAAAGPPCRAEPPGGRAGDCASCPRLPAGNAGGAVRERHLMISAITAGKAGGAATAAATARQAALARPSARPDQTGWPATCQDRQDVWRD